MNPIIFKTNDFCLSVYANDNTLAKRLATYRSVLAKRKLHWVERYVVSLQIFTENRPLVCEEKELKMLSPFFFENMKYQFEWAFKGNVQNVQAAHHLSQINDGFRFSSRKQLFGELNTANDIGHFSLPIRYVSQGIQHKAVLKFEILPSKIDLHRDLPAIYATLDNEFPLYRFNFFGKTEQGVNLGQQRGNFPLFWLAHFRQLRTELIHYLKIILQAPHQRLQPKTDYCRAEKLKGKLSAKRIEQVRQHLKNGEMQHRYAIEKQVLSVNTPENRFIKNVLVHCQKQLGAILNALQSDQFSETLRTEIRQWQQAIHKIDSQSFLRDLSPNRNEKASLVLQQKTGYSQVYNIWQDLKKYLDFFGNHREISMKSIAELYEVWCFVEMKNILLSLGFNLIKSEKEPLVLKGQEYQLNNGFGGAFVLEKNGVRLRLAHEPVFGKKGYQQIKSYWNTHKPDILLQAELQNGKKYIWLFDAKYRLNTVSEGARKSVLEEQLENEYYVGTKDYAPEDAINQMYRYRDALIYEHKNTLSLHYRPVFGAFALYPGFYDQKAEPNPYQTAIDEVGVGAFAFLPSEDGSGSYWLKQFLTQRLAEIESDIGYMQKPQRIARLGMQQHHYPDLLMTIRLGNDRDESYLAQFRNGVASCYHTKADFIQNHYRHFAMDELRYLAVAYPNAEQWEIGFIYPILQVEVKKRSVLSAIETGRENQSDESYYVFTLGKAIKLAEPMNAIPSQSFRSAIKFSTLGAFLQAENFDNLPTVYTNVIDFAD